LTWLIVEPGQFSIAPGGFLDIKVSLTKSVLDKPKKYKAENAVKIEYGGKALAIQVVARVQSHLASAGKSVSIPISGKPSTAKTGKLKDALALDLAKDPEQAKKLSSVLDFGEIKNWSDLPKPRSIALANSSSQMIKGSISIEVPWLKVEPAQFECLPGQQVILKIELSDGTRGLTSRAKPYKAEDAICIQTDSQKYDLRASVVIQVGR
jgi:hypothetical protein